MLKVAIITPLSLDSDTRSYKQACSVYTVGFDTTVVELFKSSIEFHEGFKIISLNNKSSTFSNGSSRVSKIQKYKNWLKKNEHKLPFGIKQLLYFVSLLLFIINYLWKYNISYIFKVPKADLYILHAYHQFLLILIKSKLSGAKYIYEAHDFYSDLNKSMDLTEFEQKWLGPFYDFYERICIRYCYKLITVTEGISDLYEKEFNIKPIVIRNVQDFRKQFSPPIGLREMLSLKNDDILLVIIGQAKKGMALDQVVKAISKLPENVYLALIGKNFESLKNLISEQGLSHKIFFPGPVGANQVIKFVASADISIISYYALSINYYFSLPNGLFQSIGANLAVLYPNLPEISKIGNKYEIGLTIDPLDSEDIYKKIMILLNNKNLLQQYKDNCKNANIALSWEEEEKVLLKLVSESFLN
ncbi:MAG: glycosyltransferase [Saprospiraceae bacterium]|jgi:glycosyltransferase involved in cell wall biosynthesis|nr:glycosyltransferase [Saprospiraceae bacterium]